MADNGANRKRAGVVVKDARICGSEQGARSEAALDHRKAHYPEYFWRGHHVSGADDAGNYSLRIVLELSRAWRSGADGKLGDFDFRRCYANQSHSHLLVADCFPRRRSGDDAAGVEFLGRWLARCVGCKEQELEINIWCYRTRAPQNFLTL